MPLTVSSNSANNIVSHISHRRLDNDEPAKISQNIGPGATGNGKKPEPDHDKALNLITRKADRAVMARDALETAKAKDPNSETGARMKRIAAAADVSVKDLNFGHITQLPGKKRSEMSAEEKSLDRDRQIETAHTIAAEQGRPIATLCDNGSKSITAVMPSGETKVFPAVDENGVKASDAFEKWEDNRRDEAKRAGKEFKPTGMIFENTSEGYYGADPTVDENGEPLFELQLAISATDADTATAGMSKLMRSPNYAEGGKEIAMPEIPVRTEGERLSKEFERLDNLPQTFVKAEGNQKPVILKA